ncbi:DUF7260 family protein [Halobacterium noricense]|uniref:DUF7260 family protein n=1 Tax=Halobacterium noricense TaxID=223182 RepID=UPI001E54F102|nr:hypothetical protein [Halobacterium noricense]UHH27202.1 hypothetical protein LT974_16280 [Halobacterium noricense]
MSDADSKRNPQYFVDSLQQHVLAPLSTAESRLNREHAEVIVERDAFEAFRERLDSIDPAPSTSPDRATRISNHASTTDRVDRVRTAYHETVLNMPHYDDTYDESLIEHLAGEFGPKIAEGVRPESSVSFTAAYKHVLIEVAAEAAQRRENFLETIDEEARSIESAWTDLKDIFAALDTTIIPEWHCESFTEQLDAVAQRRQRTIQQRDSVPRFDDHSLCAYLYENESWTYPVLTAVARTREAVSLERSTRPGTTNAADPGRRNS